MFNENKYEPRENPEPREKNPRKKLEKLMLEISREVNQALGLDLINQEGAIDMQAWAKANGSQDLKNDQNFVKAREIKFSGIDQESVRNDYLRNYGLREEEAMLEQYRKEREKQKGIIFEKAKTALFHKFVGDKFVVVHTSHYDDYKNNVDNLMVNRETGDPVCAFDEVRAEGENDKKLQEKIDKVKNLAENGGTEIKYGFSFDKDLKNGNNALVLKKLKNIPTFCLSVTSKNLDELLEAISDDPHDEPSQTEQKIFQELVRALREQTEMLRPNTDSQKQFRSAGHSLRAQMKTFQKINLCSALEQNLRNFESSLKIMENRVGK
ncbi:MAG: hypothetical protein Q8N68_03555 [bacterium]|nr:hypothetical protein [bacterium]